MPDHSAYLWEPSRRASGGQTRRAPPPAVDIEEAADLARRVPARPTTESFPPRRRRTEAEALARQQTSPRVRTIPAGDPGWVR
jgi:hypothetical protein